MGATSRTIVAREFAVDGSKAMEAFENVPYDGAASSGTGQCAAGNSEWSP